MTRKVTPLLLAATVFLTGATAAWVGSVTPSFADITSVDELSDVNADHWAYEALRDLVEKYDVIEGYPNGTFRGNKAPTRWEMAAALNALIQAVGRDIARLGAEKANKSDVETIARLQEQFRDELAALAARTSALEARATAIEAKNAEQDDRLTLLEKTQIHGDFSAGILADMHSDGVGSAREADAQDAIAALARLRLTLDVPIVEDKEESVIGDGVFHARLITGIGRGTPAGTNAGGTAFVDPTTGQIASGTVSPYGSFNSFSRLGTDISQSNDNGVNTRPLLYADRLYYSQHFKSALPMLADWDKEGKTSSDLFFGVIPWRDLFDKSSYRGNELTQFQNTAFVNISGIPVNIDQPMIAYRYSHKFTDNTNMSLTAGIGSPVNSDVMDGLNATYEARLNLFQTSEMPTSVYAGGFHIFNNGQGGLLNYGQTSFTANRLAVGPRDRNGNYLQMDRGATNGFYAGWDQAWYKGIGTNVTYMYSSNGSGGTIFNSLNQNLGAFYPGGAGTTVVNGSAPGGGLIPFPIYTQAQQSVSAVLHVPMAALFDDLREKDHFGIGYAGTDLHQLTSLMTGGFETGWEHAAELYYTYYVNDQFSIVPSVQLIMNRMGMKSNGLSYVLGLRTNFTF
ncbi:MAG: iron uptake porin [Candidatus Melainabacteria bacterium]|nr:iron uptake porin [Candidatus Melainabacteria bacterium]